MSNVSTPEQALWDKFKPSGIDYNKVSPTTTEIIELSAEEIRQVIDGNPLFAGITTSRFMSRADFVAQHASGTLRKGARIGLNTSNHTTHERIAYEFGWGFESAHTSTITLGPVFSEGDCRAITELGWHGERYITRAYLGDEVAVKYITCERPGEERVEGPGIVVTRTSAPFIPKGHLVFAIVAPVKDKQYLPPENPF